MASQCEGTKICTLSVITSDWISKECSWINASNTKPWINRGGDFSRQDQSLGFAAKDGGIENYDITISVNAFLNGNKTNYGFLLEPAANTSEANYNPMIDHQYYSSEYPDIRLRPALILEY